jgi:hypothetical protein
MNPRQQDSTMRRFLACLLLSNLALLTGCTGPDDGGPGTEDAVLEIDTGTGGEGSGVTGTGGTEPADNEAVESDQGGNY